MLDLRWIRAEPEALDRALARRGAEPVARQILALDERRRGAQTAFQEVQSRRKDLSKLIGKAKGKGEDASDLMAEVEGLKDKAGAAEADEKAAAEAIDALLSTLPNVLADDVPDGPDESANVELRRVGEPPQFDFEPKDHVAIGEGLGGLNFEGAAKLSGARFVVMQGTVARLHRALAQFMLDLQTQEHGYTETNPPVLVRDAALYGTGQLPKFAEDSFQTTDGYWLTATSEITMTNLVAGEILAEADLPIRRTAHTLCFRSEAGSAGRDTRGMIRQHQFEKVELVSITTPDLSEAEHERMTGCAEEVLKRLGLAYRVVVLCAGDTGFGARKTYDIEVWLPGQDTYREISSCSNCGDFQARRMNARFKPAEGKGNVFCHTLNGSGLAVGRTLVAVLENYQQADGSVIVPEVLRPYMGGIDRIDGDRP
ncbi:MAG: serine--tRNA ligase [Alphaproteobacteria bacterium]|nr:serine--tRNA ligase [Alphaproteobacteria bacterium]MCB9930875.1 serine--tRNA ligase [Alphaproteobacteria bacterium]